MEAFKGLQEGGKNAVDVSDYVLFLLINHPRIT